MYSNMNGSVGLTFVSCKGEKKKTKKKRKRKKNKTEGKIDYELR